MFGRHPRLPVDLAFGTHRDQQESQSYHEFVQALKKRLEYAYGVASSSISGSQKEQKRKFDLKVRGAVVEVGDRVLVRNVGLRGKQKIADRWAPDVHVIVAQPNNDIPVYVVIKENGKGYSRTVHRNMLLPLTSVPPGHLISKEDPVEVPNRHFEPTGAEKDVQGPEDPMVPAGQGETNTNPTGPTTIQTDSLDNMLTEEEPNMEVCSSTSDDIEIVPSSPAQGSSDPDGMSQDGSNNLVSDDEDSSEEETPPARPQRGRQPPAWLRDKAWEYMAMVTGPRRRRLSRKDRTRIFSQQVVKSFITHMLHEIPNLSQAEIAPGTQARLQMVIR
jgi:hypothetical protein